MEPEEQALSPQTPKDDPRPILYGGAALVAAIVLLVIFVDSPTNPQKMLREHQEATQATEKATKEADAEKALAAAGSNLYLVNQVSQSYYTTPAGKRATATVREGTSYALYRLIDSLNRKAWVELAQGVGEWDRDSPGQHPETIAALKADLAKHLAPALLAQAEDEAQKGLLVQAKKTIDYLVKRFPGSPEAAQAAAMRPRLKEIASIAKDNAEAKRLAKSDAEAEALLRKYSDVEISGWSCRNRGGVVTTTGTIKNISRTSIAAGVVIVDFFTTKAQRLGSAEGSIEERILEPGQSSRFRVVGNGGPEAERCAIRARTRSGGYLGVFDNN